MNIKEMSCVAFHELSLILYSALLDAKRASILYFRPVRQVALFIFFIFRSEKNRKENLLKTSSQLVPFLTIFLFVVAIAAMIDQWVVITMVKGNINACFCKG